MRVLAPLLLVCLCGCAQFPVLATPTPTPTAVAPIVRPLPGRGYSIEGHGSAQTDELTPDIGGSLPIGIVVITLAHSGRSTFVVTALQEGGSEVLTSDIGRYSGQRPLVVTGAVAFDVVADGDWSLKVQPMSSGGSPAFSGRGDLVSPYFTPPSGTGNWYISHDGTTFTAYAHCVGGSVQAAQHSEPFMEARQVTFARGPCFWEVRADGAWSITPAS
jgi:hypothetical protein